MSRQVPIGTQALRVSARAKIGRPHQCTGARSRLTDPAATAFIQRALIRVALLMRVVPVLQAVATLAFGFCVYQRPWLGLVAGFIALIWSAWLALRAWPGVRSAALLCQADTAIAMLALLAVGLAMPAPLLATAFYWPAAYAAVVGLMLGMSLPVAKAIGGLGLLVATYALITCVEAGAHALAAIAGNAAGFAVYLTSGVIIAAYGRKLTETVAQSREATLCREAQLGAEQARLEEFRRLHDEAVQVLERVSVAAGSEAAGLRDYAVGAAARLRAAIDHAGPVPGSVRDVLYRATAGFAQLGFDITVEAGASLPNPGGQALAKLGAAVTEALNNCRKHSGADQAVVRAARTADGIEVSVADQGVGFAAEPACYGFGIKHSICRRLAEIGGGAEIRSAPGAGTVIRMWLPALSPTGAAREPIGLRAERTLTMLVLATRTAYCVYAAAVVALNFGGYRHPALAVAALLLALGSSAGLGARVWRGQAVHGPAAVLDTAGAAAVLILVAAAIAPGRPGSLNWALAYAVACAMWLAFGEGLWWRAVLACSLGVVYGVSVLHGTHAATAGIITAMVNAASPPMYLGIATVALWVIRRIVAEMAAEQDLEQHQRHELAAVAERNRLIREVHRSVLATLDLIGCDHRQWDELRSRARSEVIALRAVFNGCADSGGDPAGLRVALAWLARDRASQGWRIDLTGDGIERDPSPAVTRALCAAIAELTTGSAPEDGVVRVRAEAGATAPDAEVLIRIPACERAMAGLVSRAHSRLTSVGGAAGLERALPGEVRVRLRVPA
jgi:signal transduction histidine kinase